MRPLFILFKIAIVGILWSILFIEGLRVILIANWYFDIFRSSHWLHAWLLWKAGWVIDELKEWAFILIIFTAIPVWLTGWFALSSIKWEKGRYYFTILLSAIDKLRLKLLNNIFSKINKPQNIKQATYVKKTKTAVVPSEKKTSLSPEKRAQLSGITYKPKPATTWSNTTPSTTSNLPKPKEKDFSHSLFEIDDDDTFDFDLFDDNNKSDTQDPVIEQPKKSNSKPPNLNGDAKPATKLKRNNDSNNDSNKNKNYHSNSTFEILKQKGYEIISGITLKDVSIDFVGVSKSVMCLCLNDKETGDWLADEERFNDEEPLWFSENSHRISPVHRIKMAKEFLNTKLDDLGLKFDIKLFVIEQIGNIINAEDMLDTWKDLDVKVCRIDRGMPKELPLFAKILNDVDEKISNDIVEKLKKSLRNNI